MPGKVLISRVPDRFVRTITLTGASALGLVNVSIAVATITGRVLLNDIAIFCSTLLASSGGGSIAFGSPNSFNGIIAATTATDIDADEFWRDTSPELEVSRALNDRVIGGANLILRPSVATIQSGVLEIAIYWTPMSADGNLAL